MSLDPRLAALGLSLVGEGPEVERQLEAPLFNPLTGKALDQVRLNLSEDRLNVTAPPELVGLPPLSLAQLQSAPDLESTLSQGLEEHLFHLSRRTSELQTLGLSPRVEPSTLELSAEVVAAPYGFTLTSDRRGQLRLSKATRDGEPLAVAAAPTFELSEFRELAALSAYLVALVGGETAAPAVATQASAPQGWITFGEVAERFGAQARLPPRSSLEVLMEIRVQGTQYRFAAVRLVGRSFRGLLAGPAGKVWAGRFELGEFRGVVPLVSEVLGVPQEAVEVRPLVSGAKG